MIQQKIKNSEGMVLLNNDEWITAKEWNERTDPRWSLTLLDYQDQIDLAKTMYQEEIKLLDEEINNLKAEQSIIKEEFNLSELKKLYIDLKEAIRIAENKPKVKSNNPRINYVLTDSEVLKITKQIDYMNEGIATKLFQNKIEIETKENVKIKAKEKYDKKMKEISDDLISKRKKINPDCEYWQNIGIKYIPTKHDYMPIENENDLLVLKTEEYKIDEEKTKKKKEIANQLNTLYPEKLIDGTMIELYNEKVLEIDNLVEIEDIKNYKL